MRTFVLLAALALASGAQSTSAQDLVQICGGARGPQQAIAACNSLIQTSPMDFAYRASLFYNRGLARAYLDDLDGAIEDFTRALQDRPNYADAYNNRGFAYAKKGQLRAALSDLDNALTINPDHSNARQTRDRVVKQLRDEGGPPDPGAPGPGSASSLIDDWQTQGSTIGHQYRFQSDGTYVHTIFRVDPGITTPVQTTRGTYVVQGDQLILTERGGVSMTYRWSIGRDPYVPGSRVRILSLIGPQGEQQLYGSSR
jgi:tetratricopeptide (TPR) repeat protein